MAAENSVETVVYYHGTKADLQVGDLLAPGFNSNYGKRLKASWIYFSATLNAAIWGAELAEGPAPQRIYVVEPTGAFIDDPNLTDKKFPGNPTLSYRSQAPLRVVDEIRTWQGHGEDELRKMLEHVERSRQAGIEAID